MHVGIFADLEGSFGIWRMRQCRTGTAEWQYGRECLTQDVNAVICGAFDGGASDVTVKDTHDTGFNCLREELDPRAEYVGGHFAKPTFFARVDHFDLVLYVAIHAASGTPNAFFPHTHYGVLSELKLNGKQICEMELYGGYLGEYGLPIGFVSGEDIAVDQALAALPWARGVPVDKRKDTYTKGESSVAYLREGRSRLRETAAEAVQDSSSMQPLRYEGHLHFEATFRDEATARRFNTWNFPRAGGTVEFGAANMIEGFDELNKLIFFPRRMYPVRRAVLSVLRRWYGLRSSRLAPKPNREGA